MQRLGRFATGLASLYAFGCGGGTLVPEPQAANAPQATPLADVGPEPAALAATEAPGRSPSVRERSLIEDLAAEAQRVRRLLLRTPVGVTVQTSGVIRAHLAAQIEQDGLFQRRAVYTALGLIPEDLDVRSLLLGVLEDEVIGYYEPSGGYLAIRDDVMASFRESGEDDEANATARLVLVHEMVHALQNQAFPNVDFMGAGLSLDARLALHQLLEGDASLAMLADIARAWGRPLSALISDPSALRALLSASSRELGGPLASAPAAIRVPLESAYLDGVLFAAALHGRGGWDAVNAAFASPPVATAQVLHPDLQRRAPGVAVLPEFDVLTRALWRAGIEETLGELLASIYFAQGTEQDRDEDAAAGWDCDRLRLYQRPDGRTAVVWVLRFETEADAEEALAAADRRREQANDPEQLTHRVGQSLFIAHGVHARLQPRLRVEFGDAT